MPFVDGGIYLDLNGASMHTSPRVEGRSAGWIRRPDGALQPVEAVEEERYNESNPGIGLRYEWGDSNALRKFIMAGMYQNSINRQTNYLAAGIKKRLLGDDSLYLDAGAAAGGMTGYGDGINNALLPMVSVGGGRYGVNLMYAPKQTDSPETYMLNMSYRLK